MDGAEYDATSPADWTALVEQWQVREWREEARFAKLMFIVSKLAGAESELSDFLPPHPTEKPAITNRGQHGLAAFLKSHARNEAHG